MDVHGEALRANVALQKQERQRCDNVSGSATDLKTTADGTVSRLPSEFGSRRQVEHVGMKCKCKLTCAAVTGSRSSWPQRGRPRAGKCPGDHQERRQPQQECMTAEKEAQGALSCMHDFVRGRKGSKCTSDGSYTSRSNFVKLIKAVRVASTSSAATCRTRSFSHINGLRDSRRSGRSIPASARGALSEDRHA